MLFKLNRYVICAHDTPCLKVCKYQGVSRNSKYFLCKSKEETTINNNNLKPITVQSNILSRASFSCMIFFYVYLLYIHSCI